MRKPEWYTVTYCDAGPHELSARLRKAESEDSNKRVFWCNVMINKLKKLDTASNKSYRCRSGAKRCEEEY